MAVWTLARRQRPLNPPLLQRIQANCALLFAGNGRFVAELVRCLPRRTSTMPWKINPRGHDPRQIDLLAVIAIVIAIVAIGHYVNQSPRPPAKGAFIEPSQSVRW